MIRGVVQFHWFPLCWHHRFLRSCGRSVRQWYCCTSSAAPLYKNPSLFAFLVHHPWRILRESGNVKWQNTETTCVNTHSVSSGWVGWTIMSGRSSPFQVQQSSLMSDGRFHSVRKLSCILAFLFTKNPHTHISWYCYVCEDFTLTLHWFPSLSILTNPKLKHNILNSNFNLN